MVNSIVLLLTLIGHNMIFMWYISLECLYKQLQNSYLMGIGVTDSHMKQFLQFFTMEKLFNQMKLNPQHI